MLIEKGSIRCNKCGGLMPPKDSCPTCGKMTCHIQISWHGKRYRFYTDASGAYYTPISAIKVLSVMNRQIEDKTFNPKSWQAAQLKGRKFEDVVDKWLRNKKSYVDQKQLSPGTYCTYSSLSNHLLNPDWGLGRWDIRDITYTEIRQFQTDLYEKSGLYATSQELTMRLFPNIFRWAKREGIVTAIPDFPVVGKSQNKKAQYPLDDEGTKIALDLIPEKHRDIFEFETLTGVRPGEAAAFKIKDFNFKLGRVTVRRTIAARNIVHESDKGKNITKHPERAILPLLPRAIEIVKKHASERIPDDWLFINPDTKRRYTVYTLNRYWKKFTKLEVTHYVGTRHSWATQLSEKIEDRSVLQALLRHSNPTTTARYVHQRVEFLREKLLKAQGVIDINEVKKAKARGVIDINEVKKAKEKANVS